MRKIILILLLLNLNNHVYSIEPDVFVQSTVNRASQILSKNISKEEKIDELNQDTFLSQPELAFWARHMQGVVLSNTVQQPAL